VPGGERDVIGIALVLHAYLGWLSVLDMVDSPRPGWVQLSAPRKVVNVIAIFLFWMPAMIASLFLPWDKCPVEFLWKIRNA
jgi:hypothetical protein